jgi:hypothetical protein
MTLLALVFLALAVLGLWALASIERHHRRELERAREERDRRGGGGQLMRGCPLGPTLIVVAGLPVCRSAVAHEATHSLFALEGDADMDHRRPEWGRILDAEHASRCPPLSGAWLERTRQALETWGIDGGGP